jgi:hypothetical protein
MAEEHYTVSEAARLLGLTPGRIRQMLLSGELDGSKEPTSDRWRVSQAAVLERRAERKPQELPAGSADSGPWIAQVRELERELGRIIGRLELTEVAESTLRESLERERERADRLETELRAERERGFWSRLFGG